jgi:hypothetical protein
MMSGFSLMQVKAYSKKEPNCFILSHHLLSYENENSSRPVLVCAHGLRWHFFAFPSGSQGQRSRPDRRW